MDIELLLGIGRFILATTLLLLLTVPTAFIIIQMEMKIIAQLALRYGPNRWIPTISLNSARSRSRPASAMRASSRCGRLMSAIRSTSDSCRRRNAMCRRCREAMLATDALRALADGRGGAKARIPAVSGRPMVPSFAGRGRGWRGAAEGPAVPTW